MKQHEKSSPKIARWILCAMRNAIDHESLIGDFDELYQDIAHRKGVIHARIWYWSQIAKTIPGFAASSIRKSIAMSKSYMKVTIRSFIKNKLFSSINASGLAIGMVCCILILLYVQDELSYDRYHENADNIYRVLEFITNGDVNEEFASMPYPAGPTLLEEYPHLINSSVRFFDMQAPSLSLQYEDKSFNETRFFFTDSTVFNIFSFKFIKGNPDEALKTPFSIVVTKDMAEKYFGAEDPLGKILRYEAQYDFLITGIVENTPSNSHFKFDFLASWTSLPTILRQGYDGWYWNPAWTYVQLHENVKPKTLEEQFPVFIQKYFPVFLKDKVTMALQPLTDIHLYSRLDNEIATNSDASHVYIFSGIAIVILLIACVNFMNLATSRSMYRVKEIGLRKVMGAYRNQLIRQFLGESVLLSFVSMIFAVIAILFFLPPFNSFTEKEMTFNLMNNGQMVGGMLVLTLFVGIVSGMYPAFFLSNFQPVKVLKGSHKGGGNSSIIFRKVLVVIQFAISIMLIIGTGTAYKQLSFMQNKNLGFDKEGVILIPKPRTFNKITFDAWKNRILQNANVKYVTAVDGKPGIFNQSESFIPEVATGGNTVQLPRFVVEFDFVEVMGMEMIVGRSFTTDFAADSIGGVIINEAAAKTFGWEPEEAIGKKFSNGSGQRRVTGVVKNFHFASLHKEIDPFVMRMSEIPRAFSFSVKYLVIRVNTENVISTMQFVEEKWDEIAQGIAFEYHFMDDELNKQYRAEQKLGIITKIFSSLAICIACLGLFALAAFTAEQKTKEIGIRKVLGATVPGITTLLSKEFTHLVLISNIIAIPTAYYLVNKWLQSFAYRIDIGISVFVVSAAIALAIAIITVSYQSVKAGLANPINSLRSE